MVIAAAAATANAPPAVESVVVTAQKPQVQTLVDRKVYTVSAELLATTGSAADILNTLPSVEVDADGALTLRGDSSVTVLVDGKPSAQLSGPAAGLGLLQFPASDIDQVEVIDAANGRIVANLKRVHADGVFDGRIPRRRKPFAYRLRLSHGAAMREIEDPFRFPPVLGDTDLWLLAEGRHQRLYEKLGAHAAVIDGVAGFSFAVWAPNASRVSIVGDFNQWDGRMHPLRLRRECGVWEIFLPGLRAGACYKYEIKDAGGALLPLKADPFAFATEHRPATASVVSAPPMVEQGAVPPSAAHHQPV